MKRYQLKNIRISDIAKLRLLELLIHREYANIIIPSICLADKLSHKPSLCIFLNLRKQYSYTLSQIDCPSLSYLS